nr:hypothetical protein [Tanacetum cinerariifolium]
AEGTLSFFVLLLGYGLLVLVLSSPVEDKPFELEFMPFLVMTEGCETVIGFVLELALTVLETELEVTGFDKAFVSPILERISAMVSLQT